MNKFCLSSEVPNHTLKALDMKRIIQPDMTENSKPFNYFHRIKDILEGCSIIEWGCLYPLEPAGTADEMLAGKTEPVAPKNRIFYFKFKATVLTEEEKNKAKKILRSFPQYFEWVE